MWPPDGRLRVLLEQGLRSRVNESAYVLGLEDAADSDRLRALYCGSSGASAQCLQARLRAHGRNLDFAPPNLAADDGPTETPSGPDDRELRGLAHALSVRAPRWRVLAYWTCVPSGWEDLAASQLRRVTAGNPDLVVLGGLLPTRHAHAWQTAAAGALDASAGGACWWCWQDGRPHREADCPRKAAGEPARGDLTAGALETARAKIRDLQRDLEELQSAYNELDLGYSIEKGKREAPARPPGPPPRSAKSRACASSRAFSLRSRSGP